MAHVCQYRFRVSPELWFLRNTLALTRYDTYFPPTDRTVMHALTRKATAQALSVAGVGDALPLLLLLLALLPPKILRGCDKEWCRGIDAASGGNGRRTA